jgi:hypothetical protein
MADASCHFRAHLQSADVDHFREKLAMQKITAQQIRSSFINASRSEAAKANLPRNFETINWDNLEFLGWRDEKMPQRGYLVVPHRGELTGIMLRAPEGGSGKRRVVLCELCRDVFSKDDVYLWVAKKAGQSGKDGNTVGTLICAEFGCSANVRKEPPANEINPDPAAVVVRQIAGLESRTEQFLDRVRAK